MMIITILIENLGDHKHWLVFLALLYVLLITSTDCAKLIIIGLLRHFSWTQYLDISTGCWLQVTTCFLATLNTSWGGSCQFSALLLVLRFPNMHLAALLSSQDSCKP